MPRPPYPDVLTPREWEVLDLLREGLTNDQIARRLGISRDGAKYHVSEIISKLGVASRREAAAWQPELAAHRWRFAAFAPLLALKQLSLSTTAKVVSTVIFAGAAAGLALLAFGVISMNSRGEAALGKLAYVHDGDIWTQDLPDGHPKPVTTGGHAYAPRWSPSGEWLSYVTSTDGPAVRVVRADGSSAHRVNAYGAIWSPTADRLVYLDHHGSLIAENADGSGRTVLAEADDYLRVYMSEPKWSPDGQWVAFVRDDRADVIVRSDDIALWVVRPDGSEAREIYSLGRQARNSMFTVGWSADSSRVLFVVAAGFPQAQSGVPLQAVPIAGGPALDVGVNVLVTPTSGGSRNLNDDYFDTAGNGKLAVVSGSGREAWTNKYIAVVDPAGGRFVQLTSSGTVALSPSWSPDGSQIAYVSQPDMGAVVDDGHSDTGMTRRRIWLMAADGSNKRRLTSDEANIEERPRWSSDGAYILFARLDVESPYDAPASLWLFRLSNGSMIEVVSDLDTRIHFEDTSGLPPIDGPIGFFGHNDWSEVFDWWQSNP